MPNSRKEAFELIDELGAPEHLKTHVTLVGEAADLLIEAVGSLGIELDFEFVRVGVVIHDIGKTVHINEMTGPGSEHEPEGEKIVGMCLLNSITNSKKLLRVDTRGYSEV